MRSFVVGTAGHIDHGKSALVRALTGTDPDRLPEEQARGITIDLGFAHSSLADDVVASFVDVPGHERFVRNMLAGAHGVDALLLVVAADESVMPQTREHFEICRLLGIRGGVVALTKCDVADADSVSLAELEARELTAGSFLDGAPLLRVSAKTGEGLPALRTALLELARRSPPRPATGLLRLPVDRVFTLRGFGTVATGTLVSGTLSSGDELEVMPGGRRTRVRGLHVHGKPVETVAAGSRAAVNLAGIEVQQLARGDVLASPGTLRATSLLDVELRVLAGEKAVRDQARLRVHLASAEVLARVRVLSGGEIAAGAAGVAQLRLERPAVAGRGDPFVLRSYSPARTMGGGRVLDPLPAKRRHADRETALLLAELGAADVVRAAEIVVAAAGPAGIETGALAARVTAPLGGPEGPLARQGTLVGLGADGAPAVYVSEAALRALGLRVSEEIGEFHRANPLRAGMAREELRRRVLPRGAAAIFEEVLRRGERAGELRQAADTVALAGHTVTLSPVEQAARDALLAAAKSAGLAGIERAQAPAAARSDPALGERVLRLLLVERALQRVGEDRLVHKDPLDELKERVRARWPAGTRLDVAEAKELTGLSRKFVIPLLEYLDRERVTRRSGADRVVIGTAGR
jgi:selenocysteine-specific elongation factor